MKKTSKLCEMEKFVKSHLLRAAFVRAGARHTSSGNCSTAWPLDFFFFGTWKRVKQKRKHVCMTSKRFI